MIVQDVQYIYMSLTWRRGLLLLKMGNLINHYPSDYVWKGLFEFGTARNKIPRKGLSKLTPKSLHFNQISNLIRKSFI